MVLVDSIPVCHSHLMSMTYFRPIQSCGHSVYCVPRTPNGGYTGTGITHTTSPTNNKRYYLFNGTVNHTPTLYQQSIVGLHSPPPYHRYLLFGWIHTFLVWFRVSDWRNTDRKYDLVVLVLVVAL